MEEFHNGRRSPGVGTPSIPTSGISAESGTSVGEMTNVAGFMGSMDNDIVGIHGLTLEGKIIGNSKCK